MDEPEPVQEPVIVNIPNPRPDSTREVFRFDWDKMDYVYKDELKKETGTYRDPGVMPDFYVQTIDEGKTHNENKQVLIKGKRFRVNQRPDGTMQLIPIR